MGDVALVQPQLTEPGEHQTVEPVPVDVGCRVLPPLGDLRRLRPQRPGNGTAVGAVQRAHHGAGAARPADLIFPGG